MIKFLDKSPHKNPLEPKVLVIQPKTNAYKKSKSMFSTVSNSRSDSSSSEEQALSQCSSGTDIENKRENIKNKTVSTEKQYKEDKEKEKVTKTSRKYCGERRKNLADQKQSLDSLLTIRTVDDVDEDDDGGGGDDDDDEEDDEEDDEDDDDDDDHSSTQYGKISTRTVIVKEQQENKAELCTTTESDSDEDPQDSQKEEQSAKNEDFYSKTLILSRKPRSRKPKEVKSRSKITVGYKYDEILGIHIHETEILKFKKYIKYPRIRISWYDINKGDFVKKSERKRNVIFINNETENIDYIQPVITNAGHCIGNGRFAFKWNEIIEINDDFEYLLNENHIVFFEILEIVSSNSKNLRKKAKSSGWHKICWAYLKPFSPESTLVNVNCTLQLYKYKNKMKNRTIFEEFSKKRRNKYPSTLKIMLKPTKSKVSNFATVSPLSKINSVVTRTDPIATPSSNIWKNAFSAMKMRCFEFPNKISSSKTFRKGSTVCKFSPDGKSLAFTKQFDIIIAKLDNLEDFERLSGHMEFIHCLKWYQLKDSIGQVILTTSEDCFCIVWRKYQNNKWTHMGLAHPTFLYSATLLEVHNSLIVVTGGKDAILKLWKIPKKYKKSNEEKPQELIAEIHDHKSYIIGLCRIKLQRFVSAEINGKIFEYSKQKGSEKWMQIRKITAIPGPIEHIRLHPKLGRIFATTHSSLYSLDIGSTFPKRISTEVLSSKRGFHRFTLSRCGVYAYIPSNDSTIHIYNVMTENIVEKLPIKMCRGSFISSMDCHPDGKYLAISFYGKTDGGYSLYEAVLEDGTNNSDEKYRMAEILTSKNGIAAVTKTNVTSTKSKFVEILEKLDEMFLLDANGNETDDRKLVDKLDDDASVVSDVRKTFTISSKATQKAEGSQLKSTGTYTVAKSQKRQSDNEDFSNLTFTIEPLRDNSQDTDASESLKSVF